MLLRAIDIRIADSARCQRPPQRRLDGKGRREGDDAQNIRLGNAVKPGDLRAADELAPQGLLEPETLCEDDVEGQLVGTGILRADDIGNIG